MLFFLFGNSLLTMSYSLDLRKRAITLVEEGVLPRGVIAKLLSITTQTLRNWLKRTELQASKTGAKTPRKLPIEKLQQVIDETSDATLSEYAELLGVTPQAVFYACKRNKLTRKKNHALPRTK
jgi:transposase